MQVRLLLTGIADVVVNGPTDTDWLRLEMLTALVGSDVLMPP